MRRKRVLALLACAILVGVLGHWGYQSYIRYSARSLRREAAELEKDGRPKEAARRLSRYLRLEPHDLDALARYAALLKHIAKTQNERTNALLVLEQVLRRDGSRSDIRRLTAELAFESGRYADAKWHLEYLLKEAPSDVEILRRLAWCEAGIGHPEAAVAWYARAVRQAPDRADIYLEYASLLRKQLRQADEAEKLILRLVQTNERSVPARLAASRYYREVRKWEEAEKQVEFALGELKADGPEIFLAAADLALARGRQDKAQQYLETGLKRSPGNGRLSQELARLELAQHHRDQARRYLDVSLKRLGERPNDLAEQPDDLWRLGNLLLDAGDADAVKPVLRSLDQGGMVSVADCLRARLQMHQENWGAARQTLEKVRARGPLTPENGKVVNYLLAECYGRLGSPEQQLRAYRAALESDPAWVPARRGLITALAAVGKLDLAIAESYSLSNQVPRERQELARLLLRRNLERAPAARRWVRLDSALAIIQEEGPPTPNLRLFRAEVLAARGMPAQARQLAEQERDRDPAQVRPWLFLIGLAEQQGKAANALALVDEAERRAGPRVEWQLARASHWAHVGGPAAVARLRSLEGSLGQFPEPDRDRLLTGLGEAYAAAGDTGSAEPLWRRLAQRQPHNLPVRLLLLEVALRAGREPDARHWLGEVRRVEGEGGPAAAYGEAAMQVFLARRDGTALPDEARRQLAEAAALRPSWSRVALLEAQMYELEGKREKASEKLQEALELKKSQPLAPGRLAETLWHWGDGAQALPSSANRPPAEVALLDARRLVADLAYSDGDDEGGGDAGYGPATSQVSWGSTAAGDSFFTPEWKSFRSMSRSRSGRAPEREDGDIEGGESEDFIYKVPAEFDWGLLVRIVLVSGVALWLAKGISEKTRG